MYPLVYSETKISMLLQKIKNLFFKKRVLIIVGPTASGKSSLAIGVAKKYDGEIITCDSRQIYKGLEIFSGAVTPQTDGGIKHHLLSFLNPGEIYSAERFIEDSLPIIDELHSKKKLPIIEGGTGFWAQALMYDSPFPTVQPDYQLRTQLDELTTEELFEKLQEQDPKRAVDMDPKNRKRLIRALEIVKTLGAVPRVREVVRKNYKFIFVYLRPDKELLDERIGKNVQVRMKQGLINEAKIITKGLSQGQCEELGQGYKYILDVLSGELSEEDFMLRLKQEEVQYAKRQKTFLNKVYRRIKGKKIMITSLNPEYRMKAVSKLL